MRLSSSLTLFTKFVTPAALFLFSTVFYLKNGIANSDLRFLAIVMWGGIFICALFWVAPIKEVAFRDRKFVISNFMRRIEVPADHLKRIEENRWGQTANIVLIFDPPTAFGAKVRVITPTFRFNEVAEALRPLVKAKNA